MSKWIQSFYKEWKSLNPFAKIMSGLTLGVLVYLLIHYGTTIETFDNDQSFVHKTDQSIYDSFYVDVYDDILFSEFKNEYEIGTILNKTTPTKRSVILDIGSGTGHHVGLLTQKGYDCQGIDVSSAMVAKAKRNYPSSKFIHGDVLKSIHFQPNSFTHITCLYFTIYMIKNKRLFFQNCMQWLKPGGYLLLHLVDRDKFDPILPVADVLAYVNPQDYTKKRITTTQAVFKNHNYKADFKLNHNKGSFIETFVHRKNGSVRKHTHHLYMDTQQSILSLAQSAGFILSSQSDMKSVGYKHQYIYILQKTE